MSRVRTIDTERLLRHMLNNPEQARADLFLDIEHGKFAPEEDQLLIEPVESKDDSVQVNVPSYFEEPAAPPKKRAKRRKKRVVTKKKRRVVEKKRGVVPKSPKKPLKDKHAYECQSCKREIYTKKFKLCLKCRKAKKSIEETSRQVRASHPSLFAGKGRHSKAKMCESCGVPHTGRHPGTCECDWCRFKKQKEVDHGIREPPKEPIRNPYKWSEERKAKFKATVAERKKVPMGAEEYDPEPDEPRQDDEETNEEFLERTERDRIQERTLLGLARVKAQGKKLGRPWAKEKALKKAMKKELKSLVPSSAGGVDANAQE